MSNPNTENRNPAPANGNGGNGSTKTEKKNIFVRAYDGGKKVLIKIKGTRGGRAMIKVGKFAVAGLGLYEAYRFGQKSVKPTTVYITEGVAESESAEEETPVEETEEEIEEKE